MPGSSTRTLTALPLTFNFLATAIAGLPRDERLCQALGHGCYAQNHHSGMAVRLFSSRECCAAVADWNRVVRAGFTPDGTLPQALVDRLSSLLRTGALALGLGAIAAITAINLWREECHDRTF